MTWYQHKSKRAEAVLPTLTDRLCEELFDLLESQPDAADLSVRLRMEDEELTFDVSTMQTDDMMFLHHGRMILVIDARTALRLAGHTIDLRSSDGGPCFELYSPPDA